MGRGKSQGNHLAVEFDSVFGSRRGTHGDLLQARLLAEGLTEPVSEEIVTPLRMLADWYPGADLLPPDDYADELFDQEYLVVGSDDGVTYVTSVGIKLLQETPTSHFIFGYPHTDAFKILRLCFRNSWETQEEDIQEIESYVDTGLITFNADLPDDKVQLTDKGCDRVRQSVIRAETP